MSDPLTRAALANRHTTSSFNTLDKHKARGAFDPVAAMRLLRNNVRDVAPGVAYDTAQRIAAQLLTHWKESHNASDTDTQSE